MALGPKAFAEIGGAAILPHDCVEHRLPGFAIPHNRRLTLISNADGRHIGCLRTRLRYRLERHGNLGENDLFWTVFDPSRPRKYLIKFLLRDSANCSSLVKQ